MPSAGRTLHPVIEAGHTLVEMVVASVVAVMLVGFVVAASSESMENFREAERRTTARQDLRRGLLEVERGLRSSYRDAVFAVRPNEDPASGDLPADTPGSALFLSQVTGFDSATATALYGDAVCYYVASDPSIGGDSLYRRMWTGTTDVTSAPTRTDRIAIGVTTTDPFLRTAAGTVRMALGIRRSNTPESVDVADAIEVYVHGP